MSILVEGSTNVGVTSFTFQLSGGGSDGGNILYSITLPSNFTGSFSGESGVPVTFTAVQYQSILTAIQDAIEATAPAQTWSWAGDQTWPGNNGV